MPDRTTEVELEEISAEEAFAVLGNEIRMEILRALWEAEGPSSFADLRRRVAPGDNGNFSYHLGKLTGHFVRKTDEGYLLRFSGERVVRAVLTGVITSDPEVPPAETDERCLYCGAPVEMAYEKEVISARCTDCGGVIDEEYPKGTYLHYEFPPAGLVDRTREAMIDAAHILYDSKFAPLAKGVCPECAGPVELSHAVCENHEVDESGLCSTCETRYKVWSTYECEHCLYTRRSVMWFAALNHPAVIAFFFEHGLDEKVPLRKLTWDNARFVRGIQTTVVEPEPYLFRVTIPVEDDTLVALLDENLDVLTIRRGDGDE